MEKVDEAAELAALLRRKRMLMAVVCTGNYFGLFVRMVAASATAAGSNITAAK